MAMSGIALKAHKASRLFFGERCQLPKRFLRCSLGEMFSVDVAKEIKSSGPRGVTTCFWVTECA